MEFALKSAKEKAEESEAELQFINKRFELAVKTGSIGIGILQQI